LHLLYEYLVLTVNIASKERVIAARAFIELTDVKGVLERLLIEAITRV